MMSKIASMLMELKDTSEMMIDLAYSSLLYDNTEIAEEVIALSDNLESLSERIQDEIAQAGTAMESSSTSTAAMTGIYFINQTPTLQ